MELTTQEQDILDEMETNLKDYPPHIHESLAIHWMSAESPIDKNKAQELLQKYAIYTTDKYGNDVIISIGDEPSEEQTYTDGTHTE